MDKDDEYRLILRQRAHEIVEAVMLDQIANAEGKEKEFIFYLHLSDLMQVYPEYIELIMNAPEENIEAIIYQIEFKLREAKPDPNTITIGQKIFGIVEPIVRIVPYLSLSFTNSNSFRNDKTGKLVRVKGFLTALSQIQLKKTKSRLECPKCNYKKIINSDRNISEDRECPSKTCSGAFLNVTPIHENIQTLFINESADTLQRNETPNNIPCSFKISNIQEDYISSALQGDILDLFGVLKSDPKGEFYVDILHHSTLQALRITTEEREKIYRMSRDNPDFLTEIGKAMHKNLYGLDNIKTISVVFCVGLHGDLPPEIREPSISVAFVGEPASGKSDIAKNMIKYVPRAALVPAPQTTAVGLVGGQDEHPVTNKKIFVSGNILRSNNSVLVLDEWGKDKSQENLAMTLLNPLQDSELSINKAYFRGSFKLNMSFVFITNPLETHYTFDTILGQQNIITPLILERCIMSIYFMPDNAKETKQKIREYQSNRKKEDTHLKINDDFLKKYIKVAKEHPNPIIPPDIYEKIDLYFDEIDERFISNVNRNIGETYIGVGEKRSYANFIKLLVAFCRAKLKDKVELSDVIELGRICFDIYWKPNYTIYGSGDPNKIPHYIEEANKIKIPKTQREIQEAVMEFFNDDKIVEAQHIVEKMEQLGINELLTDKHIAELLRTDYIEPQGANKYKRKRF